MAKFELCVVLGILFFSLAEPSVLI